MSEIIRRYSNGEVTVVWQPSRCIHSGNCFRGLPAVFDPRERPWVRVDAAATAELVTQVERCPSGALTIERQAAPAGHDDPDQPVRIQVSANGPLIVTGVVTVVDAAGVETRREGRCALCRCGGSANKPFCDGTHKRIEFQG